MCLQVPRTQSQLVCSFQSQGVNKILRACRNFGNVDVVEMGQIKVFVQKLGLKQGFLADTNMDYFTSEWPGMPNFKVDANFDVFPQKYG